MKESPITLKEKASFGLGAIGKDMACGIIYTYLMLYFTDVVGVTATFVGIIFLVARIWDAVNDPIMGLIVDNTKTRWGKFRPWILIGTLVNSVIVLCLFYNPAQFIDSEAGVMTYCAVVYILWGMSYTIMDIPYWSMIPAFSSDSKVRDVMSVIPRTCAMFGGQFVSIFGLGLVAYFGVQSGGTESDGFFRFTLLIVAVFIVTEIICVANIREHVKTPMRQKITVGGMFRILGKNDQLLVIILLTVLLLIAQNLVNGAVLYYFKYALKNEALYPYFMATGAVGQLIAFLTFPLLVAKTSRRTVYCIALSMMMLGYLGLFAFGSVEGANEYLTCFLFAVASFGLALSNVCTTVMLADTVDYGEFKLGVRSESIVFSMQTMTVKFGSAIAGFLTGITLTIVGYVPNVEQTPETLLGLRLVMFVASSVILVITLFIYLKWYKLNGAFYKNMLSALEVSREKMRAEREESLPVRYALHRSLMTPHVGYSSKEEAIEAMIKNLASRGEITDIEALKKAVYEREAMGPTGIADGIAIPHAKCAAVKKPVLAIASLNSGVDFQSPDGKKCDLVFLLASPADSDAHLNVLGRLSLLLNDPKVVSDLRAATGADEIYDILTQKEKQIAAK